MKKWFVKKYISLAEVFEWKVPAWMLKSDPDGSIKAALEQEQDLTHALSQQSQDDPPVPGNLEYRIETRLGQKIVEQPEIPSRNSGLLGWLVPVAACAAATVLGIYMLTRPLDVVENSPQEIVQSQPVQTNLPQVPVEQIRAVARLAGIDPQDGADIIMQPLANEKDRLAADVTNALRYVARGIVPDPYVEEVDRRITFLQPGYRESI